jgi:polysaccharide biosynthesis transport protein
MTARSLFAALWRQRRLALVVFVVEFAVVLIWLVAEPRRYTAAATITATPSAALLASTGNYEDLETTLAQIADSRSVLGDVRDRLDGARSIGVLRNEISGVRVGGTVLVRVSVEDPDRRMAARIANTVAAVLPLHDPSGGQFVFTQTDRAVPPSDYSSPNTRLVLLVGAVLGVFLAAAAALLRDRTARTVETAGQLRASAGTDVLATLPRPRDPDDVIDDDPDGPVADALRSLRVELDYVSSDRPTGAIVVADATGEDRQAPWLAMNLAASLAQVDHRVLVIDGDFRDGQRPAALTGRTSPGLYAVLRGTCSVQDAMRPGPRPGVTVLPAGEAPQSGSGHRIELGFRRVLDDLDGLFDAVLVLAPPPSVSDDARVMAIGGSLLLVVAARSVREPKLRELIADLRATRTRVLGAVLIGSRNRVRV